MCKSGIEHPGFLFLFLTYKRINVLTFVLNGIQHNHEMRNLEILVLILTILGSLSLFLFGMKLMSESLQRFSGNRLRTIFSSIASNRFKAISAGFVVTGIIQSSSAITVMLVSFVNAGLFSLSQALAIMMGANIGTTVTAWLITLFGFKFELSSILLPLLGLSLPLLFLPGVRNRAAGEFLLGFVILFLGLEFMKNSLPDINENSPILTFFTSISDHVTVKYLIFAGAGLIVTMIIQSSSATIALTIVMCSKGYITYDAAVAMVLGENLGTTITANLAALMANRAAKRLALGHALFNFFGLIWAFIFFGLLVKLSFNAATLLSGSIPVPTQELYPVGLSILHSGFNLINTLILAWFIPAFKRLLEVIIPLLESEKKSYKLRYFRSAYMAINDVDILQVREEIHNFGTHSTDMFGLIPEYLLKKGEDKYDKLRKEIYKCAEHSDEINKEITHYLTRIAENDLTKVNSQRISAMFKINDEIENITNQCLQMERTIRYKNEAGAWFSQEMRENLFALFNLINEAFAVMNENLSQEYKPAAFTKSSEIENKINELHAKLLQTNKLRIESGENTFKQGTYFIELTNHAETLANHIFNVNQALTGNS